MQHSIYFITNKVGELNTDNTTFANTDDSLELSSMFVLTASGCKNVREKQQCNSLGCLLLIRADGVARQDNETKSYDYAPTQKSLTFTKDSMTQTIEVPVYDDPYKENDETFWLTPVSTSGYSEAMYLNNLYEEKYQTLIINSSENFIKQDIIFSNFRKVA